MSIVICADGSHDIGYGHLIRSRTVAQECLNRGHKVSYATTTIPQVTETVPQEVSVIDASTTESQHHWLSAHSPDVIIIDGQHFNTTDYQYLRDSVETLVAVVDDSQTTVSADILINSNIYADTISHEWEPPEPKFCLGLDYLLLRQSFRTLASQTPPWRDQPEQALIIMGGVDKENRTPAAIRAFADCEIDVTAVIGPGYTNATEIRASAEATPTDVSVVEEPPDLPRRMFETDFAVCTLGTITYELLATQTPIIGIPDNETPIDTVLVDRDLAIVLDRETDTIEIGTAVKTLCSDTDRRKQLWRAGADLVTSNGPSNVVDVIEELTDSY